MADNEEYIVPEDLDDMDVGVIHQRMLNELPLNIDKTEGGFAYDMTRPSAMEKSYAMEALNLVVQWIFPEFSTGTVLDRHAKRVGLTRKEALPATGTLHIIGTAEITIQKGFVFCTPATQITSNVNYTADEDTTLAYNSTSEKYEADVSITCAEGGVIGNAPANAITLMASPIDGIESITNPAALTDGVDTETDEALLARIQDHDLDQNVSHIGNNSDYKRWALEVDGVGTASVIPEWQGAGTGTVKIIILNSNGGQASSALIQAVYEHIMGPEEDQDKRLAPMGAILTVATADAMTLNFAAEVELEDDYTLATVKDGFEKLLNAYFTQAKEEGEIKYTRVARCLSETPGVADYQNLTINSDTDNIEVDVDELPVITSLTLTEAEV